MRFKNARLYGSDFRFHSGGFGVENGMFTQVGAVAADADATDLGGMTVIPGLIDIHSHGNSGFSFEKGNPEEFSVMLRYLAKNGVTSVSVSTGARDEVSLAKCLGCAAHCRDHKAPDQAAIRSVTLEGPFFNREKKGGMQEQYLRDPDLTLLARLEEKARGLLKIACVAPELPGAGEYIQVASRRMTVSIGHTAATYSQAMEAFAKGATHVTHLFNAMNSIHHREPGVVCAAADSRGVTAELISDGIHIHPSVVRAAFRLLGAEKIALISDSNEFCGMAEGEYRLDGRVFIIKDRKTTLLDGTIAGGVTTLFDAMVLAVSFGIPLEDAVRCATWNPARQIGALDQAGSIENGKDADFLVLDEKLQLRQSYVGGNPVL